MIEKMKPCPFCGCNDRRVGVRRIGNKGYKVICSRCGAAGPYSRIEEFESKIEAQEYAVAEWNNRKG